MTQFITNQERRLADEISNIMPGCRALHFLVGYFYFSGFEQIYRNLADKYIRILVGLDLERDLAGRLREFEMLRDTGSSRGQTRENYYTSLIALFNDSSYFDRRETQEAFRLFLAKILDGSLEIRKTKDPNHAKLYIFENKPEFSQNGSYPGTVITGSSNLTRSGLETRFEINKDFRDAAHYAEAREIFERLWQDSVVIVDTDHLGQFQQQVISRIWLDKLPSPYLIFVRVLEEYFREDRSAALDDLLRQPGDNPTIGLLLCRSKNKVVVEYALRHLRRPIGVAQWETSIVKTLPKEFKGALPTVAEIEKELSRGGRAGKMESPQ